MASSSYKKSSDLSKLFKLNQNDLPEINSQSSSHSYIPVLHSSYFKEHPIIDQKLWNKVKNQTSWSASLIPITEWNGILYIACVKPTQLQLQQPYVLLLSTLKDLQAVWDQITVSSKEDSSPQETLPLKDTLPLKKNSDLKNTLPLKQPDQAKESPSLQHQKKTTVLEKSKSTKKQINQNSKLPKLLSVLSHTSTLKKKPESNLEIKLDQTTNKKTDISKDKDAGKEKTHSSEFHLNSESDIVLDQEPIWIQCFKKISGMLSSSAQVQHKSSKNQNFSVTNKKSTLNLANQPKINSLKKTPPTHDQKKQSQAQSMTQLQKKNQQAKKIKKQQSCFSLFQIIQQLLPKIHLLKKFQHSKKKNLSSRFKNLHLASNKKDHHLNSNHNQKLYVKNSSIHKVNKKKSSTISTYKKSIQPLFSLKSNVPITSPDTSSTLSQNDTQKNYTHNKSKDHTSSLSQPTISIASDDDKKQSTPKPSKLNSVKKTETKPEDQSPVVSPIRSILETTKSHVESYILFKCNNQLFTPIKWSYNLKPLNKRPVPVHEPSVFRICYVSKQPYYGYLTAVSMNTIFFENWGFTSLPEHVTLIPFLDKKKEKVIGGYLGISKTTPISNHLLDQLSDQVQELGKFYHEDKKIA